MDRDEALKRIVKLENLLHDTLEPLGALHTLEEMKGYNRSASHIKSLLTRIYIELAQRAKK